MKRTKLLLLAGVAVLMVAGVGYRMPQDPTVEGVPERRRSRRLDHRGLPRPRVVADTDDGVGFRDDHEPRSARLDDRDDGRALRRRARDRRPGDHDHGRNERLRVRPSGRPGGCEHRLDGDRRRTGRTPAGADRPAPARRGRSMSPDAARRGVGLRLGQRDHVRRPVGLVQRAEMHFRRSTSTALTRTHKAPTCSPALSRISSAGSA